MERKLFRLFDYQKFERNENLQRIIDATHAACELRGTGAGRVLSMDELDAVSAAGDPHLQILDKK